MPKHSRKLLLLAAICWVAPLSAQQRPAAADHPNRNGPACPKARALAEAQAAQARGNPTTVIVVQSNGALGEVPRYGSAHRAFQP